MYPDAIRSAIHQEMTEAWRTFAEALEQSLDQLEKEIDEAAEMKEICTGEWCLATEHVIDDIANAAFSISEPRWLSNEDSAKLKAIKRRIHDLYAKRKEVVEKSEERVS